MISVIVPILNEPGIASFLDELHKVLKHMKEPYEVLVVQGDRETLFPKIPVKAHQRVVKTYADSLERSILGGFSHAKGDRLIVIDADGSHPIDLIPDLCTYLSKYEFVAGVRNGERLNVSFIRDVITYLFHTLAKLRGSKLSEPMTGFFGVQREIVDKIRFTPYTWKTALEIELKAKPTVHEVPFTFGDRLEGESKTSIRVGLNLIKNLIVLR